MVTDDIAPLLPDHVVVRIAGRLGMSFFLNCLRIFSDGRDLLDSLLLLAVQQANYGRLDGREHGGRYAALDAQVPPDLVQPISVNAIAQSLGMPFETARRRLTRLRHSGACASAGNGLMIPPSHLHTDRLRLGAFAVWGQLRNLYLSLRDLGLAGDGPSSKAEPPPVMTALRLAGEYVLRQLEGMTTHIDDPAIGVLLIHVIRATTEHLDDTYTEYSQLEDLVSDALRRPASIALLATRSGIPAETTRRYGAFLLDRGWVARAPSGGLYLTREMLRAPPWPEARRQNVTNLKRLIGGLAAAGALPHWTPA